MMRSLCLILLVIVCVNGHLQMKSNGLTSSKSMKYISTRNRIKRGAEGLTPDLIKYIVDEHNLQRRWQGAADMQLMTWHDELADLAKDWSRTCAWGHGQPKRDKLPYGFVGQNIFAGTWGTVEEIVEIGIKGFYEEIKWRNPETMQCQPSHICGHYTQVVWASTNRIGCDVTKCAQMKNLGGGFKNAFYMVCNYGPGGNAPDTQPFQPGPRCSLCPPEAGFCRDGACTAACSFDRSECSCSLQCQNCGILTDKCACDCKGEWIGAQCEKECKDYHSNCAANPGWPEDWCRHEKYADMVTKSCPAMCGTCKKVGNAPQCQAAARDCRNVCANGGQVKKEENRCVCTCSPPWYGNDCTKNYEDSPNGAIFKVELEYYKWAVAWEDMRNTIAKETNVYCRENVQKCCPGLEAAKDIKGQHDITQYKLVSVGRGYPSSDKQVGKTVVETLVMIQSAKDNAMCKDAARQAKVEEDSLEVRYLAAEIVKDILKATNQQFDNIARTCCNGAVKGIADAPTTKQQQQQQQQSDKQSSTIDKNVNGDATSPTSELNPTTPTNAEVGIATPMESIVHSTTPMEAAVNVTTEDKDVTTPTETGNITNLTETGNVTNPTETGVIQPSLVAIGVNLTITLTMNIQLVDQTETKGNLTKTTAGDVNQTNPVETEEDTSALVSSSSIVGDVNSRKPMDIEGVTTLPVSTVGDQSRPMEIGDATTSGVTADLNIITPSATEANLTPSNEEKEDNEEVKPADEGIVNSTTPAMIDFNVTAPSDSYYNQTIPMTTEATTVNVLTVPNIEVNIITSITVKLHIKTLKQDELKQESPPQIDTNDTFRELDVNKTSFNGTYTYSSSTKGGNNVTIPDSNVTQLTPTEADVNQISDLEVIQLIPTEIEINLLIPGAERSQQLSINADMNSAEGEANLEKLTMPEINVVVHTAHADPMNPSSGVTHSGQQKNTNGKYNISVKLKI